jgi:hypothetical protein
MSLASRRWREANPEKVKAIARAYYKNNKDKMKQDRKKRYQKYKVMNERHINPLVYCFKCDPSFTTPQSLKHHIKTALHFKYVNSLDIGLHQLGF